MQRPAESNIVTRVAFLLDIVDSYGEREQALQFALRIGAHEPIFVAAAAVVPALRARGAVCHAYETHAEALDRLAHLAPDIVVCSEWFNLPEALRAGVAAFRVATFDGTGMGVAINTNPFLAEIPPRTLDVPPSLIRFLPCPVNDADPDSQNVFHWALFDSLVRGHRAAVRAEWEVPAHARVVLVGIAGWAARAAAARGRMAHYRDMFSRLVAALRAVGEPTHVIVSAPWPAETASAGDVELRFVPHMASDRYERLLLGCDLVFGDNAIQYSIAKAYMAGVPTLTVMDSTATPPWNIFPLGVRASTTSAYWRAIAPVELSDARSLAARVAAAWRDEAGDPAFRAAVGGLPSPARIVEAL